jgi:hypothetical protein
VVLVSCSFQVGLLWSLSTADLEGREVPFASLWSLGLFQDLEEWLIYSQPSSATIRMLLLPLPLSQCSQVCPGSTTSRPSEPWVLFTSSSSFPSHPASVHWTFGTAGFGIWHGLKSWSWATTHWYLPKPISLTIKIAQSSTQHTIHV